MPWKPARSDSPDGGVSGTQPADEVATASFAHIQIDHHSNPNSASRDRLDGTGIANQQGP
jgi:hypothetical protein